jgi:TRAP-type C4-dicarboxylate transport system permease small subunit
MWYLLFAACVPLVLLIFAQVWLRYVFQLPLLWVEEVAVTPAFWMYMTGAAYAAYNRTHIKVDIVGVVIKDARRLLTVRFIASVITVGLAMLLLWWGINFFLEDLEAGPQTATLRYPLIYARSSLFFSAGILGGLYFVVEAVDLARQLFWHKSPLVVGGE